MLRMTVWKRPSWTCGEVAPFTTREDVARSSVEDAVHRLRTCWWTSSGSFSYARVFNRLI